MHATVQRLLDSFLQILANPELAPEGYAGGPEWTPSDVDKSAAMFAKLFAMPCPLSLQAGLILPDPVSVKWQYSLDILGEVQLSNLYSAMYRTLDASLLTETVDGYLLGDMRIADAVTDHAGPLHTLFEIRNGRISEQLFLFDSRELRRLELSYDAYLDMAAATRGIIYWQCLFCDWWIAPRMAQVLSAELDFLESRFPTTELDTLRRRLRERSE